MVIASARASTRLLYQGHEGVKELAENQSRGKSSFSKGAFRQNWHLNIIFCFIMALMFNPFNHSTVNGNEHSRFALFKETNVSFLLLLSPTNKLRVKLCLMPLRQCKRAPHDKVRRTRRWNPGVSKNMLWNRQNFKKASASGYVINGLLKLKMKMIQMLSSRGDRALIKLDGEWVHHEKPFSHTHKWIISLVFASFYRLSICGSQRNS